MQLEILLEQQEKIFNSLVIYGSQPDLSSEHKTVLKGGEQEILTANMIMVYKNLFENVKKVIAIAYHMINQINLLLQKKDPIYKITKDLKFMAELTLVGKALGNIYLLDNILE